MKYKGVSRRNGRWIARARHNDRTVHIGTYRTPEEAFVAYCAYCMRNGMWWKITDEDADEYMRLLVEFETIVPKRTCEMCGVEMDVASPLRRFCDRCRKVRHRRAAKESARRRRAKNE